MHVVSYESPKLKEHEKNNSAYGLGLIVVVYTLKIWRHNLTGRKFELRIVHNNVKCLFD